MIYVAVLPVKHFCAPLFGRERHGETQERIQILKKNLTKRISDVEKLVFKNFLFAYVLI
jgi:hypothetical protein